MENNDLTSLILGTLAFICISFIVQTMSHFAINVEHFSTIRFMRETPIFALGLTTMLIQGLVLSYLFTFYSHKHTSITKGITFGLIMGVFFVSYVAFVEPSKYQVPSIQAWMMVEGIAGMTQFIMFGAVLGLIRVKNQSGGAQA